MQVAQMDPGGVVDQLAIDAALAEQALSDQAERGPVLCEPGAEAATDLNLGGQAAVGTDKRSHVKLILEGMCTRCAHCGMKLTDSVSIERGIGPVCSQKGYEDVEPSDPDEMQAFIMLSEWPELCTHLVENFKPKGIRGLMNGLVRICSLNRRSPVHKACVDAIELLGYKKLASALRESLAVVSVRKSATHEGCVEVWVRRDVYTREYGREAHDIFGVTFDGRRKRRLVPITKMVGGEEKRVFTYVRHPNGAVKVRWAPEPPAGQTGMSNKVLLWALLCRHFENMICKTDQGGVYIRPVQGR